MCEEPMAMIKDSLEEDMDGSGDISIKFECVECGEEFDVFYTYDHMIDSGAEWYRKGSYTR